MSVMQKPAAFFAAVRGIVGPLNKDQVETINALLARAAHWPVSWLAYALATANHETGSKLVPNVESLNYSVDGLLLGFGRHRISLADAQRLGRKKGEQPLSLERQRQIGNILYGGQWGHKNLGNVKPDDGWTYRGRGLDHCTGRINYQSTGTAIRVDLLDNPDALLVPANAVAALVTGMERGRYTKVKLDDRLTRPLATLEQFTAARPIINGNDRAALIAGKAMRFQDAVLDGGWK